jgi:ribonucleoside-diphosphate reductase beta chain
MKIFNPEGSDLVNDRRIWGGNTTNIQNLNNVKYDWAVKLYKQMRENIWIPEKNDMSRDINDYINLTKEERKAYDGILSFLIFLDSIQQVNLPCFKSVEHNAITAPEIRLCLCEQESQEALHTASYQYVIETAIPVEKRNKIYDFWRDDKILLDRCQFIGNIYQGYIDNPTPENYFNFLVADYLLEAIYFFQGFIFFYSLSSRQLMSGTADIMKLINRDELSHFRLFQQLIIEAKNIFPYSEEYVYELFNKIVEHEILWNNHITDGRILGITEQSINDYTKYLCDIRLKAIGFNPLFNQEKNPYKHLDKIADLSKEGGTKANFFEASVTSYNIASCIDGWESF